MLTTWPDLLNGTFEALAGLMVLNHCRVLLKDRAVAGVSIASTVFFTFWGVWNLWYYPQLGQFWSTVGGVFVVLANTFYVALLFRFSGAGRQLRKRLGAIVCRFRGCHYNTPHFRANALYFCTRCGKEIGGLTIADPLRRLPRHHGHRPGADRLIERYSNEGGLVYDPFCGLGTVPYRAILKGRKGQGSELNTGYFFDSVQYLKAAEREFSMPSLFDVIQEAA